MKQLTKLSRTTTQLEEMFRDLNIFKFHGALATPVISISPVAHTESVSHCPKWEVRGEPQYHMTVPLHKFEGAMEDIVIMILHIMVHLSNMQGPVCNAYMDDTTGAEYISLPPIQDFSRGGTYHNKYFRMEAERRGLIVEHSDKGFQPVGISDDVRQFMEHSNWCAFLMTKYNAESDAQDNPPAPPKRRKTTSRKLHCQRCGAAAQVKADVLLKCGLCDEFLIPVCDKKLATDTRKIET